MLFTKSGRLKAGDASIDGGFTPPALARLSASNGRFSVPHFGQTSVGFSGEGVTFAKQPGQIIGITGGLGCSGSIKGHHLTFPSAVAISRSTISRITDTSIAVFRLWERVMRMQLAYLDRAKRLS